MQSTHQIRFDNSFNDWSEALPLGNGHFGGMAYLDRKDGLVFTFNHYDVYYRSNFSKDALASDNPYVRQASQFPSRDEMKRRAIEAREDPNHPAHENYNICFNPDLASSWGVTREGLAMPISGSLRLIPQPRVFESGDYSTRLEIETARVEFSAQDIELSAKVLRETDVCAVRVSGAVSESFSNIVLSIPPMRRSASETDVTHLADDDIYVITNRYSYFEYTASAPSFTDEPYCIALKVAGAETKLEIAPDSHSLQLDLANAGNGLTLLLTVIPPSSDLDLVEAARRTLNEAAGRLHELEKNHEIYWTDFFRKSRISLPDALLETLWHLHLYSLACSSGEGSRLYGEACGLNGLWDIKGPTQWGSSWYWDVNIEQAFWPVFTSNHLELAVPFHKGLLAWADAARNAAREIHGLDGIAADYPFTYYLSIWAWCAQYFWWYYTHSLDKQFLAKTAYPLFKDIVKFYQGYADYDAETGRLVIFPDVAPEQGPLTRNSLSTLSCLKYLLRFTIESSELLQCDETERQAWNEMLSKIGEYAWADSCQFGEHYKDSEWADSLLFLAHPGVLKPIFPIREINKRSSRVVQKRALGTLRYADAMHTYITFGMWQAAAAAVLGLGDEAVRMLYDRGISLMMSANGFFYEETDRWVQDCFVNSHPAYCPPMMEAGGTLVATINEMLLQSYDGIIEVFPAIPVGNSTERYQGGRINPPHLAPAPLEPWKECAFENLLAEGAFEVSAWLHDGEIAAVRIKSLCGGRVKLVDPFSPDQPVMVRGEYDEVPCERCDGIISFSTEAGLSYQVSNPRKTIKDMSRVQAETELSGALVTSAFTRRRVYLGKDRDTEFYRSLDGALLDFHAGHVPQSKLTIYKIDFTRNDLTKDYQSVMPWQWHACGKQGGAFISLASQDIYTSSIGRGWVDVTGLVCNESSGPDDLRRDSVSSLDKAELKIDLRKGQYQAFLVCGDAQMPTATTLSCTSGITTSSTTWSSDGLGAGKFATGTVLINHIYDGPLSLHFDSDLPGVPWSACALIINRII